MPGESTTSAVRIRNAAEGDLPALVEIYNHYILHTCITFDVTPFSVEDRRPWFEIFRATGPHRLLVADAGSGPVGYASSIPFRAKPAFDRSVETTIYLHPAMTGRGIGRLLYGTLLDTLEREPGVHRGYGGIASPNPESTALHLELGFRLAGTFREVGFKFGRYLDVSWYERDLSGAGPPPQR